MGSHAITATYSDAANFATPPTAGPSEQSVVSGLGLNQPYGVTTDHTGNVYIADFGNNRVLELKTDGTQATIGSDLYEPAGVVLDKDGNVYIADLGNSRVLKVAPDGTQTTLVAGLGSPIGLALDGSGDLFIADSAEGLLELSPDGNLTTAGYGLLVEPQGVAVDAAGNLFVADTGLSEVVEFKTDGTLRYFAATAPTGVTLDSAGNLYIADFGGSQVLKVTPDGIQTTIGSGYSSPAAVAVDGAGNVFVADYGDSQLVKMIAGAAVVVSPGAPRVSQVSVDSSSWSSSFDAALVTSGRGTTDGLNVPSGSHQADPLPFNNIDRIAVTFDEDVQVAQSDLAVSGINVPTYAISGFTYSQTTHTAVWALAQPVDRDRLTIVLDGHSLTGVRDSAGNLLDGEWASGVSNYPSGNGIAGGDFSFNLNVLPGDVNQDGVVNGLDISAVASNWLHVGGLLAETNGDDVVNGLDIATIASHWLKTLPSAGGAGSNLSSSVSASFAVAAPTAASTTETLFERAATSALRPLTPDAGVQILSSVSSPSKATTYRLEVAGHLAAYLDQYAGLSKEPIIDHLLSAEAEAHELLSLVSSIARTPSK